VEDGNEKFNKLIHNLGIFARPHTLLTSDSEYVLFDVTSNNHLKNKIDKSIQKLNAINDSFILKVLPCFGLQTLQMTCKIMLLSVVLLAFGIHFLYIHLVQLTILPRTMLLY
jgi:hypothetical protein